MTDNNKFIPKTQTYEVRYLENQSQEQVKKSPLSVAARNKIINRSGSNYISENQTGYDPCYLFNECSCNFKITATLVDRFGNSRTETIRPVNEQKVIDLEDRITGITFSEQWQGSYNDNFEPSMDARNILASQVHRVIIRCGSQRITVVEEPNFRNFRVSINGIRV